MCMEIGVEYLSDNAYMMEHQDVFVLFPFLIFVTTVVTINSTSIAIDIISAGINLVLSIADNSLIF